MPNDAPNSVPAGPSADSSAGGLSTTWPGLSQLQTLINETKMGVLTLESLISTPAAAMATGSPPASAAIVALGIELAVFLAETAQAMERDIQTLEQTARNYRATEADVVTAAAGVLGALFGSSSGSSSSGSLSSGSTSRGGATPGSTGRSPVGAVTTARPGRARPTGTRERVADLSTTGATR